MLCCIYYVFKCSICIDFLIKEFVPTFIRYLKTEDQNSTNSYTVNLLYSKPVSSESPVIVNTLLWTESSPIKHIFITI